MNGDSTVNTCMESKLERESQWRRKSSTAVPSNSIVAQVVANTSRIRYKQSMGKAKREVKKSVSEEIKERWNQKVRKLTMQGDFTGLLIEEEQSVT